MSRQLGHPDPAALARLPAPGLRAGLAAPRRGRRLAVHVARCPRCAQVCAQLDAVSATLSAATVPPLPSAAEHRILAALTLEAELRAKDHGVSSVPGPRRRGPHALTASRVLLPAAACVLVMCAGIGYVARGTHHGASPGGTAPRVASSPGTAEVEGTRIGAKRRSAGAAGTVAFMVTTTDTRYRKATLRTQVRDRLAAQVTVSPVQPGQSVSAPEAPHPPASTAVTGPAAGPRNAPSRSVRPSMAPPSSSLVGCVMHLTGDVRPKFVDRATYQSEPVYVIAVQNEAWVVGIGCTATRPSLITSVELTTTS